MSSAPVYVDVEQGSPAWIRARLGIPTASSFDRIVTPKGKLSAQREGYRHRLLAEWLLGGQEEDERGSPWMERGTTLEPAARSFYELLTDRTVSQVGFVYADERRLVGCSPDWIIGDDGLGEIKCPKPSTHVGYLLRGPGDRYRPQVQGQLWVTGRDWCDFLSYCPGAKPVLVRVDRDSAWMELLENAIGVFVEELLADRETLRARGVEPRPVTVTADERPCGLCEPTDEHLGDPDCADCAGSGFVEVDTRRGVSSAAAKQLPPRGGLRSVHDLQRARRAQ